MKDFDNKGDLAEAFNRIEQVHRESLERDIYCIKQMTWLYVAMTLTWLAMTALVVFGFSALVRAINH